MNVSAIVDDVTSAFRENLRPLVTAMAGAREDGLTPSHFREFLAGLKVVVNQSGREAFVATVGELDEPENIFEHGGKRHRFKMPSRKEWLTAFGVVTVERGYFQADEGGEGVVPLDLRCGMVDRYMTPDVEEISTFVSATVVPGEAQSLLAKILPRAPSVKAIQRAIADVGSFAEAEHRAIEAAVRRDAPLSADGDVLVVSWDGKPVPMREKGVKTGRPPERPGIRSSDESPTTWREAAVGTLSIYGEVDQQGRLPRLDGLYFARMPEPGMTTLLSQQTETVRDLLATRTFREFAILCDGKEAIWRAAQNIPEYQGATLILDFYHATEHLSKAAEALFGKGCEAAQSWFAKYRDRFQLDPDAVDSVIRSIRYHRTNLRKNSERFKVATRVIRYFGKNRERMRYSEFIRRGLPIGSGPVEAACKTVVGQRITRSGMRWSRDGGQHVLNLRVRVLSKRWDSLWSCYMNARTVAA